MCELHTASTKAVSWKPDSWIIPDEFFQSHGEAVKKYCDICRTIRRAGVMWMVERRLIETSVSSEKEDFRFARYLKRSNRVSPRFVIFLKNPTHSLAESASVEVKARINRIVCNDEIGSRRTSICFTGWLSALNTLRSAVLICLQHD